MCAAHALILLRERLFSLVSRILFHCLTEAVPWQKSFTFIGPPVLFQISGKVLNFYVNGLSVPELLSLKQLSFSPYQVMDSKFFYSFARPSFWKDIRQKRLKNNWCPEHKFLQIKISTAIVISNWFRCTFIRNQACPFALRKFFCNCHGFSFSRSIVRISSIQLLWNIQKYPEFNILRYWIILSYFSFLYWKKMVLLCLHCLQRALKILCTELPVTLY
jgi:hypothetical protein